MRRNDDGAISVPISIFILLSALAWILTTTPTALAAPPEGQQPGGHLRITEVLVDFNAETLAVTGEDFDFNNISKLHITLGEFGDITALCVNPPVPTASHIVCDFFGVGGLPEDGDYLLTVATGNGQSQSDEYDLTIGAAGARGEQGPKGEIGPIGPAGPQGAQGLDGPAGQQGPSGGPQGIQGELGPEGPQGIQGEQGPLGPPGTTGPQGLQGLTGEGLQGPAGPQGLQGPAGPQGTAGVGLNNRGEWVDNPVPQYGAGDYVFNRSTTSPTIISMWIFEGAGTDALSIQPFESDQWVEFSAPQGAQGSEGTQGAQGPAGLQGSQGLQGTPGAPGPAGSQGVQGLQGTAGPAGSPGPQGIQGLTGDTGSQGSQGDTGPQGPQGETGLQGIQGFIGETGSQGPQGDTGLQGLQGDTGSQGLQGVTGDTGPQGFQGLTGDSGPQGVQGLTGDTGPQGPQGLIGGTGPQGPAGPINLELVCRMLLSDVVPLPAVADAVVFLGRACPVGFMAVSGGFSTIGVVPNCHFTVFENGALVLPRQAWIVSLSTSNANCGALSIRSEVFCCPR